MFFRPAASLALSLLIQASALALPAGYQKTTIQLNAPPSGLAFAAPGSPTAGTLYAFEAPAFNVNTTNIRVIQPNLTFGADIPVTSLDSGNFFLGGMTFDHTTNEILLTDNATGANALYSVNVNTGVRTVISSAIPSIAGVAVRASGEVFVSTAPFADNSGEVLIVDRVTGVATSVHTGVDFGAGLVFDANGDLIIQDADFTTFQGRLTKLEIDDSGPELAFGPATPLISGLQAGAGLTIDSEGDLFVTGSGGLFELSGGPLAATSFDSNGNPFQFSTAVAFYAGANPFEPFASDGGRLAFLSDFGFTQEDNVITLITTGDSLSAAVPEPSTLLLLTFGLAALVSRKRRSGPARTLRSF